MWAYRSDNACVFTSNKKYNFTKINSIYCLHRHGFVNMQPDHIKQTAAKKGKRTETGTLAMSVEKVQVFFYCHVSIELSQTTREK